MVPWVGLQSVIVAFPGHTHLHVLFCLFCVNILIDTFLSDKSKYDDLKPHGGRFNVLNVAL